MEAKEFAEQLGITFEGRQEGSKYIIEVADSNEYSRMYTILDSTDLLTIDEDKTLLTDKVSELLFLGDDYDVKLVGNFESDIYRIIFTEVK